MAVVFVAWEPLFGHPPTIILIETNVETAILRFRLPYSESGNGMTPEIENMVCAIYLRKRLLLISLLV